MDKRLLLLTAVLVFAGVAFAEDWPQWGGPERNFRVPDPGLAASWPPGGLETLWQRPLGEGYSAIAVVGTRLFTQYSEGEQEVVIALDTASGTELWSHRYDAARPQGMRLQYGQGPHATPLVVDGRVFAVGTTGRLMALDAGDGEVVWQHDLWSEFEGYRLRRGYGASPLAYRNTIIVPVGGKGPGAMAFAQTDGRVVWEGERFDSTQSSPILVAVSGEPELVFFIQDEVVSLDPDSGALLWRHPHAILGPYNLSTPVSGSDSRLFVSSSYGGGSRMLKLHGAEDGPRVEELWRSKRMGIHFTNAIWIGDSIYASSGRSGVMAAAIDTGTGELRWKDRAIGRANYVQAGERVLVFEARGRLLLVELAPEGLSILAQTRVLESRTWTVPSLVHRTLYIRDREKILAVELPLEKRPQEP